jgi:hypothetical protein
MRNPKPQENRLRDQPFLQKRLLRRAGKPQQINEPRVLHGRLLKLALTSRASTSVGAPVSIAATVTVSALEG